MEAYGQKGNELDICVMSLEWSLSEKIWDKGMMYIKGNDSFKFELSSNVVVKK